MATTVKEFFGNVWKNFLNIAGQTAAASLGQMPEVQEQIQKAETERAKSLLWKIFPILFVGVILWIVVRAFK